MQGRKNRGRERGRNNGGQRAETPHSLGAGHPKLYLVQFGSSVTRD